MKAITVREAQPRLRELIAEACQGELIVLTDGEKQVALEPHVPLDLDNLVGVLECEACGSRPSSSKCGYAPM